MGNKKKKAEKYITICPKCGSPDIQSGFSNAASANIGLADKICKNCGHTAQVFPEIPISEVKKPKDPKTIKDRQLVNLAYASGLTSVWKITGIFGVIASIFILMSQEYKLGGYFLLPLSSLIIIYSFLKDKYKERKFMKIIMIAIILFFTLGLLALTLLIKK
ncbi:MAG: hypothetical protein ABIB79_02205 [archaeon]